MTSSKAPPVHGERHSELRQQHFSERTLRLCARSGEKIGCSWRATVGARRQRFCFPGSRSQCQSRYKIEPFAYVRAFADCPLVGQGTPGVALVGRLDRVAPGARPYVPSRRGRTAGHARRRRRARFAARKIPSYVRATDVGAAGIGARNLVHFLRPRPSQDHRGSPIRYPLAKPAGQSRGVSSNATENWNKIVIRRVFPALSG